MRELFFDTTHRLLTDHLSTEVHDTAEAGRWPETLWIALEEAGLGLALAREDHGGAGASWTDCYAVVHCVGWHGPPVPICETLLANWLLSKAGLNALDGPLTIASAHDLRIDPRGAVGRAHGVPWGRAARYVVAIIRDTTPCLIVLPVSQARLQLGQNIAREPRDELTFEAVEILVKAPLPRGLHPDTLKLSGAMLRAAQMAGGLARLVELAAVHANERVQFGRPIGKFQAIQQQFAVLAEQAALAEAAAELAFCRADCDLSALVIAAAKLTAGEAAGVGAAIAHAIHGAIGFTYEHPLQRTTRRLWSWRDEFGAESVWASCLGGAVCAAGAAELWPGVVAGGSCNTV